MGKKNKIISMLMLFSVLLLSVSSSKAADPFNNATDIDWGEIDPRIEGVCVCPGYPPRMGVIVVYWEPFLLLDTSATAFYSAMTGSSSGGLADELGGKNKSSDAIDIANESTFAQSHAFLLPLLNGICNRNDYGTWWSEYDAMWQNDELGGWLTPEASLFANQAMIVACMADSVAANAGWPLDAMPWCVGSGGSAYPMTGHVDNDNIVQANATVAYRMLYKLNRMGMICDPSPQCGCMFTPIWIKTNYKLAVVRPDIRGVHPIGRSTKFYDTGLNTPYMGAKGPNDQFLWVVYRVQRCCTCCE